MARIHVLTDNNTHTQGLGTEHGLSLAIALSNSHLWLWDTGQSDLFIANARAMGVDLQTLRGVALSHGHYDHTGGLSALLDKTGYLGPIYAHPGFETRRYTINGKDPARSIGLDTKAIPWPLPGFVPVNGMRNLDIGLSMATPIPRRSGLHQSVNDFFLDPHGRIPDPIRDDACLLLDGEQGPVAILGCCHSGLANTLLHLQDTFHVRALHAVIGGFHLIDADESILEESADILEEFQVERIIPGHCTGSTAMDFLKERFPNNVEFLGAGLTLDV